MSETFRVGRSEVVRYTGSTEAARLAETQDRRRFAIEGPVRGDLSLPQARDLANVLLHALGLAEAVEGLQRRVEEAEAARDEALGRLRAVREAAGV